MKICIKSRDPSLNLEGLLSAQNRLTAGHSMLPVLAAKQAAVEAGIAGEERVAKVLRSHSFPFMNHVFHDLSPSFDEPFQMDTFTLTPWYGVVFEVKNIAGILEFKENPPQLIRTREDGGRDGFESPVVQLDRNCKCLKEWLRNRHVVLPIYGAVVLAYPKQIVALAPAKTKLLFPSLIPTFIDDLPQSQKGLDEAAFKRLSAEILHSHQPFIPKPICESYHVSFYDFQKGIRCVRCSRFGMMKRPRTWVCPYCQATDHLAHQRTLREWFLVFKQTITNQECREFLGVDIHTATRILQSMNLKEEGSFKSRTYSMF